MDSGCTCTVEREDGDTVTKAVQALQFLSQLMNLIKQAVHSTGNSQA